MERIKGLNEYVKNEKYRKALNLPNEQEEEYTMLAQGEYNINYSFTHPKTGKKLLLRVNCGSQMHLENQIGYECHALQLLEASGRTPKVLYVDGSRKFLGISFIGIWGGRQRRKDSSIVFPPKSNTHFIMPHRYQDRGECTSYHPGPEMRRPTESFPGNCSVFGLSDTPVRVWAPAN